MPVERPRGGRVGFIHDVIIMLWRSLCLNREKICPDKGFFHSSHCCYSCFYLHADLLRCHSTMLMMPLCLSCETKKLFLSHSRLAPSAPDIHSSKAWVQTTCECYLMLCERGRWCLIPGKQNKKKRTRASVYAGKGRFPFIFLWTLSIGYNNFLYYPFLFSHTNPIFGYLWARPNSHKELIIIKGRKWKGQFLLLTLLRRFLQMSWGWLVGD